MTDYTIIFDGGSRGNPGQGYGSYALWRNEDGKLRRRRLRFGDQVVNARPTAYARGQTAVRLELAKPLADARPLVFDAEKKPPYLTVSSRFTNGEWTINVEPLGTGVTSTILGGTSRART